MITKLSKIVRVTLLVLTLFVGISVFQGIAPSDISLVKNACATCWGPACTGGNTGGYLVCPRNGQPVPNGKVDSSDFRITIQSNVPIPAGQRFIVQVYPSNFSSADAPGANECSNVTCLNRVAKYTTDPWPGGAGSMALPWLDQIGCSQSNVCNNNYLVQVRFADIVAGGPNCLDANNPPVPVNSIQNGFFNDVTYRLNCETPPPPVTTCVESGGVICGPQSLDKTTCAPGKVYTWNDTPNVGGLGPGDAYCKQTNTNYFCWKCVSQPTCNQTCNSSTASCISGLSCINGVCRLPENPSSTTCQPAPTPTTPPGVTTTPTPTIPGVTTTPTSTPIPSTCPVPGTPVVTVTCIGCNNDDAPTATPTNGLVSTPTPTGKANITPTDTVRITITPTPTDTGNKDTGATCNANSECKSNSCIKNSNSRTGFCR